MANTTSLSRLPSLDGWRALSIAMVFGSHVAMASPKGETSGFGWFFDGRLGVRFFFVISGFLITWLLLQEAKHSGRVNLRHFYVRRFLRILPVYYTVVLVLCALQWFTRYHEPTAGWVGMLTFTRNYTDGSIGSGHLWSLAVEEQFYLLWPGLLVLLGGCSLRVRLAVLAVPILVAPVFRLGTFVFYFEHQHIFQSPGGIHLTPAWVVNVFNSGSFLCNFDSLAFGCLGASLLAADLAFLNGLFQKKRVWVFGAGLLLVAGPHAAINLHPSGVVRVLVLTGGPSLQALGFALLLLHSLRRPEWPAYRVLNWKWVAWMGMLSYSLYIWQQIFCFRVWAGPDVWKNTPGELWAWFSLIPTFAVACLSYYGLERPLFRLRSRFRHE